MERRTILYYSKYAHGEQFSSYNSWKFIGLELTDDNDLSQHIIRFLYST